MEIVACVMDNAPDPYSTNECKEFLGELDFDDIAASVAHDKPCKRISAEHLIKVWRIDMESYQKTLNVTTQVGVRTDNNKLTRKIVTNDRMLRYKRISQFFFMDTLFATKKSGRSFRGHRCCQLFVTDKGFVYFVPKKLKGGGDYRKFKNF